MLSVEAVHESKLNASGRALITQRSNIPSAHYYLGPCFPEA